MNPSYQIVHFEFTPEGAALSSILDRYTPSEFVAKLFEVWDREELKTLSYLDGFRVRCNLVTDLEDHLDRSASRLAKNRFGKFFWLNSIVFYTEDGSIHSIYKFRNGQWMKQ
jgi:hypothetical protein